MIKKFTFFLLILCGSTLFAGSYLTNVETKPEHANMNFGGSIEFIYDLPDHSLAKKAHLQTEIDGITSVFDSTVRESGFAAINNSIVLSGKDLYETIRNRRNIEDSDDKSLADGIYSIVLRINLDTSSDETNDDEENDDDETDDSDDDSEAVPEYVEKDVKVTFDNKPPKAPAAVEVEGGNRQMLIRVTPPSNENGKAEEIGKYHAKISGVFKNGDTETQTSLKFTTSVKSGGYDKVWEFTVKGKDGYEFINNDEGSTSKTYIIDIYAEDLAGNTDESEIITIEASAVTTYGFWSNYKSHGGKDDGGFCFVATAGFGSYFHPSVALLRDFRDSVLANFDLGKKFIAAYYKYGSYPAEIIRDSSILRAFSRVLLMPLVISAWFLTTVSGQIFMLLWLVLIAFFVFKSAKRKVILSLLFVLFMTAPVHDLLAKGAVIHGEASFTNLIYYPNIDGKINGTPFKDVAGSELRWLPSLTFGLAVPTKYIRISFIGGIGYTRFKGRAIREDGSKSPDRTTMHFIPLKAELKLRPVYDFPLYPYIAGGIDYYTWWVRDGGSTTENGGTFGLHGTIGFMLSLNWLDPSASKKMNENGVFNTSLFLGYKFEKINDFWREKSFDLSNKMKNNFEFGIVFEF